MLPTLMISSLQNLSYWWGDKQQLYQAQQCHNLELNCKACKMETTRYFTSVFRFVSTKLTHQHTDYLTYLLFFMPVH